jgi:hypothetical protein
MWGWNLPTKQKDVQKLHMDDDNFSIRVSERMDQIKGLNSPILLEYANVCPVCEGPLEPIPPTIDMFKKGNKKNGPPLTCKCVSESCGQKFSSYELNVLYVDKYALKHGISPRDYSPEKIDIWSASCECLDISDPFQMIVFTIALMDLQFHYWHHAKYIILFNFIALALNAQGERHQEQNVDFSIQSFYRCSRHTLIQ